MNARMLDDLEQHCTRCLHQNASHIGTEKNRWGWPIYSQLWLDASGWCTVPGCTCKARTNDPAAAPAELVTFTPPTSHPVLPCGFWDADIRLLCGTSPARLYVNGWRCDSHSPAAVAGLPEAPMGGCAPLKHYCTPDTRCATWAWQHQPWRALATGGRDRTDKSRIWAEFDKILLVHPNLTVVQGAAYPRHVHSVRPDKSADWLIHLWCQRNKVAEEAHPADWDTCSTPTCTPKHRRPRKDRSTYCPDAGFWRNGLMVKAGADECVAFPGKGSGTRDCMRQAAAAGIPVRPIWEPTLAVADA